MLSQFGYWRTDLAEAYRQTGVLVSPSKSKQAGDNSVVFEESEQPARLPGPVGEDVIDEVAPEEEDGEGVAMFTKPQKSIEQKRAEREARKVDKQSMDDGKGSSATEEELEQQFEELWEPALRKVFQSSLKAFVARFTEAFLEQNFLSEQRETVEAKINEWFGEHPRFLQQWAAH